MQNIFKSKLNSWKCFRIELLPLVLFTILYVSSSSAQDFKFETISTINGLSQNIITCIFQDSRHFLWLGTSNGLNRYDGNKFKIYHSIHNNSSTISGHDFSSIVEDKDNNLWIGSYGGGLNKYIRKTDSFIRILSDPKNPNSPASNRITALLLDKKENLWIGTESGLSILNLRTNKYHHINAVPNNPDSLCNHQISSLREDSQGNIWIGTWIGLSMYDPNAKKFFNYIHNPKDPHSLSQNYVHVVYEDKRKNIWVGTHNGLNLFDKKKKNFTVFLPNPNNQNSINNEIIRDILEDSFGNLWIATSFRGLDLYDRDKRIFHHYMHNPFEATSLCSNNLLRLYQDDSNLLWIGSFGGGLSKLHFQKSQFQNIKHDPQAVNTLNNNHIASLTIDKDNSIWIGTLGGGLTHLTRNGKQKTFKSYYHNAANTSGIISDQVYSIAIDKEDNLWLGTESGLQKFNKSTNKFTLYNPFTSPDLLNTSIFNVMIDHSGKLWVGTYRSGLSYYDKQTNSFVNFSSDPKNNRSIASNAVRYVYEDSKKHIWVCTESGLDFFDQAKKEFIHFKANSDDPTSLLDNTVLSVFEDSMGNFWIATPFGLNRMIGNIENPQKIKFERFTTANGLPGDNIQGILEDGKKHLWISTNNGLSKFNPSTKTFDNFTVDDGLQSNGFYVTACAKIPTTGEMLFGGDEGFNIFHPDKIQHDLYPPPIVITDLSINNKHVAPDSLFDGRIILKEVINETKELTLPYTDNNISFEFASLAFANPASNRHAYKMEGHDESWIDVGNRRFASYTNLSPGEYTFRVKAANHSGVWNKNTASIKIIITPPFWKTAWFWIFSLLALAGLIVYAYKYKTRNIQKRSKDLQIEVGKRTTELQTINSQLQAEVAERIKMEEKLVASKESAEAANKSKSEFLANMSHELRTPLNAILGYTQILRKQSNITSAQKEHLSTIMKSGEHLLTLINDILDLRRIEVRREEINKAEFNLHTLIRDVINTIRIKAVEKNLSFDYKKELAVPERVIGDSKKIKQILLNLLGNAVKYTSKGSVGFDIHSQTIIPPNKNGISRSKIIFEISDTGMGIPKEKFDEVFQPFTTRYPLTANVESTGLGLAITKRLVEMMEGVLHLESKVDKGTTFKLELDFDVIEQKEKENKVFEKNIVGYTGDRKNILIVDDSKVNISMLVTILEPLGFDIMTAENGIHALENMQASTPDLILLDLLMPGMDGQQFLENVRAEKGNKLIKIIGISAAVADKKNVEKFSSDCDAFVSKPINSSLLLDKIETVLGLSWIKEDEPAQTSLDVEHDVLEEIFPPEDVISEILSAVNLGDYKELGMLLSRIESETNDYKIFCSNIKKLAKNFDDDAITKYCILKQTL